MKIYVLGLFRPFGLTTTEVSSVPVTERAKYFLIEKELLSRFNRDSIYKNSAPIRQHLELLSKDDPNFDIIQEEEILVCGNKVIWSSGETVKKSFTLDHPVLQAIITSFLNDNEHDSNHDYYPYASNLCVLDTEGMRIFTNNGNIYNVHIPCQMARLWPLPTGLLLERRKHYSQDFKSHLPYIEQDDSAPYLFSLLHPFDKVKPVYFFDKESKEKYYGKDSEYNNDINDLLVRDAHNKVVFSSSYVPLLVLYNDIQKRHSIWLLRKDSNDQYTDVDLYIENLSILPKSNIASNVFLMAKDGSDLILCFMVKEDKKLHFYQLENTTSSDSNVSLRAFYYGSISCLSAVPIDIFDPVSIRITSRLVRLSSYLVVLETNRKLSLYSLNQKIITLKMALNGNIDPNYYDYSTLPLTPINMKSKSFINLEPMTPLKPSTIPSHPFSPMSPSSPFTKEVDFLSPRQMNFSQSPSNIIHSTPIKGGSKRTSEKNFISDLVQPIGNRFNIKFNDESEYRVVLNSNPQSPILLDCIRAIKCAVTMNIFNIFLSDFLNFYNQIDDENDEIQETPEREWNIFNEYIINLLSDDNDNDQNIQIDNDNDDWEYLLKSDFHQSSKDHLYLYHLDNDDKLNINERKITSSNIKKSTYSQFILEYLPHIFNSLHLLYENYKLNILSNELSQSLVRLLIKMASLLNWNEYIQYYQHEYPHLHVSLDNLNTSLNIKPIYPQPPSILDFINKTLKGKKLDFPLLKGTNNPCDRIRSICRLYHLLKFGNMENDDSFEPIDSIPMEMTVNLIKSPKTSPVKTAYSRSNIWKDRARMTVAALTEEFKDVKDLDTLPYGISLPLREAIYEVRKNPPYNWPPRCYYFIGRTDLAHQPIPYSSLLSTKDTVEHIKDKKDINTNIKDEKDGNDDIDDISLKYDGTDIKNIGSMMRFSQDDRLDDVSSYFNLTKPVLFKQSDITGNEEDLNEALQTVLFKSLQKQFAKIIGRGMYTLYADHYDVIDSMDQKSKDMHSLSEIMKTEPVKIPKISLDGRIPDTNSMFTLNPSRFHQDILMWPSFHNGVSAGLRLSRGDYEQVNPSWITYNRHKGEFSNEHAGFILALGLLGHLKSFPLTLSFDYLTVNHPPTTVGLLLGLTASAIGTSDEEILKLLNFHTNTPSINNLDIAPIIQASVFICLGLLHYGTMDRISCEIFLNQIPAKKASMEIREAYSLCAGIGLGLVCIGNDPNKGHLSNMNITDKLYSFIDGSHGNNEIYNHQIDHSSHLIHERSYINTDITASSAIMALTLIYMKSNNSTVSKRLSLPSTVFLLDYIRPDQMILRTIGKNLIMWDSIEPTKEWIQSQYPKIVRDFGKKLKKQKMLNIKLDNDDSITLLQSYLSILAGAHMSIGLRFAGSLLTAISDILMDGLNEILLFHKNVQEPSEKGVIEMCLITTLLSICTVMAGSGDLNIYRKIRSLRKKGREENAYGYHMALGMATGLLFLGGGRCTLSTSNKSIASLLISLYPIFPSNCFDNQYHIQVLRHLYVFGIENRFFETRDVDSLLPCYVPIKIKLNEDKLIQSLQSMSIIHTTAPCILPPYEWISTIEIDSNRYWKNCLYPDKIELHSFIIKMKRYLLLKRKESYLSYTDDPDMDHSILTRQRPRICVQKELNYHDGSSSRINNKDDNIVEFIKSFTNDPYAISFAEYFCDDNNDGTFFMKILFECLANDKMDILNTYLQLNHFLSKNPDSLNQKDIEYIKIILSFYESGMNLQLDNHNDIMKKESSSLIDTSFLMFLKWHIESRVKIENHQNIDLDIQLNQFYK